MIAALARISFVWKGRTSKRFRYVLNIDEEEELELSVYIADDPVLLDIVDKLRSIEHQIYIETRMANSDFEDYQKVKTIIEAITI